MKTTVKINYFQNQLEQVDEKNSYLKNWLEIKRDYPIAITQLVTNQKDADIFAGKILKKALRYHHTIAVIAITQEMPRYIIFSGSNYNSIYYIELLEKHQKIQEAELKAKMFSARVNIDFSRRMTNKKRLENINGYLKVLESYDVKSYEFQKFYFELLLKQAELKQDDELILETCNKGILEMSDKQFKISPQSIYALEHTKIPILIKTGQFDEARKLIKKWSKILRHRKNNYMVLLSYHIILLFRTNEIGKARRFFNEINVYPTPLFKDRFAMFECYLNIYSKRNKSFSKDHLYEFRKDKSGYNIPIVIVELIQLLKDNTDQSKDIYIESVEAIEKNMYRHIKRGSRCQLFVKMLLMIPKCNFNRDQFVLKSKNLKNQLDSISIQAESIELEMIPFGNLFNRVLELLD